jgi:hypothetical protein
MIHKIMLQDDFQVTVFHASAWHAALMMDILEKFPGFV